MTIYLSGSDEDRCNMEYEYQEDKGVSSLMRTKCSPCTEHCRGEKVASIKETASENFKIKIDGQKMKLDAAKLAELYYILAIYCRENNITHDVDIVSNEIIRTI